MFPNSTGMLWFAVYNLHNDSGITFSIQVLDLLHIFKFNLRDILHTDAVIADILPRILTNKQLYNLGDLIME